MDELIKTVDLCCGAGGWACAARGLAVQFVAVADWSEDCLETWRINHAGDHPDCELLAVDLSTEEGLERLLSAISPGVDLVLGGLPCEQVSPLRGNRPLSEADLDAWYKLIDNCITVVDRLKPRWWCLEDVIQIERHLPLPIEQNGREIPIFRIEAADFGPQCRLRTFLGRFPRPAPKPDRLRVLADCLLPGPHLTIAHAEDYTQSPTNSQRIGTEFIRVCDRQRPCPTVTGSFVSRGSRQRRSFIVTDDDSRRRVLSWQEAALIQGFPKDFLFAGGVQRASEMIGRAIPVYVGHAILQAITDEGVTKEPT